MYLHANAKLGLAGRLALVRSVDDGLSLKAAAARFRVSPATAHRWWHRWLDGGREGSALLDRSSRPHRSPRLLAAELQERICDCRRKTGWGPRLVAGATGCAHSTVWKVLKRAGLSRRHSTVKEPANSYEWPCPGDLLHMDTSRYARFLRPAIVSLATAHSAHAAGCGRKRVSDTTSRTRSSTTTRGSPTSSSTTTRKPKRSPASSGGRSPSSKATRSSASG
ncbi:MAG: transposase [Actinobacteria bacterium]|nr:MAG: transposase [Actinomycetota bacterium]